MHAVTLKSSVQNNLQHDRNWFWTRKSARNNAPAPVPQMKLEELKSKELTRQRQLVQQAQDHEMREVARVDTWLVPTRGRLGPWVRPPQLGDIAYRTTTGLPW